MEEMKKIGERMYAVRNGELSESDVMNYNKVLQTIHAKFPIGAIISGSQIHVCKPTSNGRTVARFVLDDSVDDSVDILEFCYYGENDENHTVVNDSVALLSFLTDVCLQNGYRKVQVDLKRFDFRLTREEQVEIAERAGFTFLPFSWEKAVKYSETEMAKAYDLEQVFEGKLGSLTVHQYLSCLQAAHYYLCAYDYDATLPYVQDESSLQNGKEWITYRNESISLLEGIKQEKKISALDYKMLRVIIEQYKHFQHGIKEEYNKLKLIAHTCQHTYFGIEVTLNEEANQTLEEQYEAFVGVYDFL